MFLRKLRAIFPFLSMERLDIILFPKVVEGTLYHPPS